MALGLGVLGLAPTAFWSMTLKEIEAAIRGRLGPTASAGPLERGALAALMIQFPDTREDDAK